MKIINPICAIQRFNNSWINMWLWCQPCSQIRMLWKWIQGSRGCISTHKFFYIEKYFCMVYPKISLFINNTYYIVWIDMIVTTFNYYPINCFITISIFLWLFHLSLFLHSLFSLFIIKEYLKIKFKLNLVKVVPVSND